jgi:hypothetical protein
MFNEFANILKPSLCIIPARERNLAFEGSRKVAPNCAGWYFPLAGFLLVCKKVII